jgi:NAD(P)-dependent dehydrogenase (short-subunit alcohol dehydrogenase family)
MANHSEQTAPLSLGLRDQHVIIVGGSSGIGRATAKAVLALGGSVTLISRSHEKLAAAADGLSVPDRTATHSLDMTHEDDVKAYFANLQAGSIDHLVISASSAVHGKFAELDTAPVRAMFDAKFWGPYVVAREALPAIADHGSITFFSGVLSRRPGINCSGLGAVNAAVEGLTVALALELGPRVRVNCCSPGMVRTEAYSGVPEGKREAMYESTGESLPVGRVGRPYELADAVLFLMTNTYVTGRVLDVDGGHMIRQYATR